MDNLISIIIPAYNSEKYIRRAIFSLQQQTHQNIEIIIVNDGSTDETASIIEEIASKDNRIKIIHKENSGVSDSRNKGIEAASGDYIGFVDSDDEVFLEMYEILYNEIRRNNADISHCGFELVTPIDTRIFYGTENLLVQNTSEAIKSLLKGFPFEPSACTKLFSKKVLKNVFFEKEIRINEDLLFNVEAFKNAQNIVFYDKVLYRYLHNPNSASRSGIEIDKLSDVVRVAEIIKKELPNAELKKQVNAFYSAKLITVLQTLYKNRRKHVFTDEVKKKLAITSNVGLSKRLLVLKYSLLYFTAGYSALRFFYEKLSGSNKKWSNH